MNENTESTLDPNEDDLPLMANAGYMLVRHYVLDLTVNFDRKVINSTIVLFLEANQEHKKAPHSVGTGCCPSSQALSETEQPGPSCNPIARAAACSSVDKICNLSEHIGNSVTTVNSCNHSNKEWASGISGTREHCSDGADFELVLDCCDLVVNKVEEVNVIAAAGIEKLIRVDMPKSENGIYSQRLQSDVQRNVVEDILGLAAECWQEQHHYYLQCSQAPGCGELQFQTDMWSLKIKKPGVQTPQDFPRVLRICYETKPEGGSVRWTKDQSGSPHIIFLSQSVLSGEKHLCGVRLCHEIAHAWFGLAIGARDWTEEWISEGFATYLEDVFWANAQKLSEEAAKEQQQLKSMLRWRRLQDELQNSEEELQVLRPNKESTGEVSDSGATIVKHGLNPGKTFMQVHYLKGYFFLHYLENRVGQKAFLKFFRLFVERFHGQLILSQDFLHMFMANFSELRSQGLSMEAIYQNWLDVAGLPKPFVDDTLKWTENRLVCEVQDEVAKWTKFNKKDRKGTSKRKRNDMVTFKELLPDQLVLLLELLFAVKSLSSRTLHWLQKHYCLREQDAEVRHRWCELVIKHKHTVAYGDLINFLEQDQAMGVYLYGELMVNEDAKQQQLVHRCFTKLQEEMDPSLQKVVAEMIL
ncbi:aminopeptidase O isoform X3 [Mustelus asterias]